MGRPSARHTHTHIVVDVDVRELRARAAWQNTVSLLRLCVRGPRTHSTNETIN